jgi:hypothetical protein
MDWLHACMMICNSYDEYTNLQYIYNFEAAAMFEWQSENKVGRLQLAKDPCCQNCLSKSLVCNSGLLTAHAALYFLVGV